MLTRKRDSAPQTRQMHREARSVPLEVHPVSTRCPKKSLAGVHNDPCLFSKLSRRSCTSNSGSIIPEIKDGLDTQIREFIYDWVCENSLARDNRKQLSHTVRIGYNTC